MVFIKREIFEFNALSEGELSSALATLRPKGRNALVMIEQPGERLLGIIHHRSHGYAVTLYAEGEFVAVDTRLPARPRKHSPWWRIFGRSPRDFFSFEEMERIAEWIALDRPQPSFAALVQLA